MMLGNFDGRIPRSCGCRSLRPAATLLLTSMLTLGGCGETSTPQAEAPERGAAGAAEEAHPAARLPETAPPDMAGPVEEPAPAPPDVPLSGPSLRFDSTEHDFGLIWDTEEHPCSFDFINRGDGPLQIRRITSSCSCTLARLDKWQYAPGEAGSIATTFEPTKTGPQAQTITVLSNDPARPVVKLSVVADVRQFISFDERFARFGQVQRHREHKQQITLRCAGTDMVVEGIESGNPYITTEILQVDAEGGRAVIEATLHDDAPWGIIRNATIDCTVSGRLPDGRSAQKMKTIRAIGTVVDEIRSDLYSMSVGIIPPGGGFSGSATVYHVDGEPFELAEAVIRDAKHAAMDLTVAEARQDFVGGYQLTVRGRADYDDDELILGVIEFRAVTRSDPTGSVRRIPIIGKIGHPQR
jgi:hypothetical protein